MDSKILLSEAKNYQRELIEWRRYLHKDPGVGFDVSHSVEFVKAKLREMGYQPMDCGKAGVIALAGGKKEGKVFLLRADMDALPGKEESGEEFAAKNGNMHACGHDLHTAMLLGAAKLLKSREDEINGTVKLMFQPAEEIFEGAKDMIDAGVLEAPKVDAALMLHVMAGVPLDTGTMVISSPGTSAPAADYFDITVYGKGCHGAAPNAGVDPITAAAHVLLALQEISARELPMGEKAVLTVGSFHAGKASNAIPNKAQLSGTLRTFNEETRAFIKKRIEEISTLVAQSFRTKAEVVFSRGCPAFYNDPCMADSTGKFMKELLGESFVMQQAQVNDSCESGLAGSEDFAYVAQRVPTLMVSVGAGDISKGYIYPQHHPKIIFDEDVLFIGSAAYAYAAMRWLEEN